MAEPTNHELSERIAVPEERMNTKHAEYATAAERLTGETRSAIDRLRTDMADLKTDMARRDVEAGKRDRDNLRWQIGLWVAAVVILGFIIRFPG